MNFRFFLFACGWSGCLFAQAPQEVFSFAEVDTSLQPGDLLILDIDNTLMIPKQQLGSDQWFYFRLNALIQAGCGKKEALEEALRDWHAVQAITKVLPCEPCTSEWVTRWQDAGIPVMGLTTRGLGLSQITCDQLDTLKINLHRTAPARDERLYLNPWGVLLRQGILFTAGTHKGKAFMQFLDDLKLQPSRVVFVNDKATHIKELQETVEERGLAFLGLRYGAVDDWVRSFDPRLTEIQWQHFGHILTDQEARDRLLPCPAAAGL